MKPFRIGEAEIGGTRPFILAGPCVVESEELCLTVARRLKAHGVTLLLDVRKIPRSRSNPQFNIDTLPQQLAYAGIGLRGF